MAELTISEIAAGIVRNAAETHALRERVDYLTVAVARGDPRFTREEFATPGFDSTAFDADWQRRGKRIPTLEEVYG